MAYYPCYPFLSGALSFTVTQILKLFYIIKYLFGYKTVFFPSLAGFSLSPYLESFTPTFGLGTPDFPRMSSNLHCGTPTFPKRCLWDSYFQNPSENTV